MINSALFEHICLQNTKKLYKYAGKCDNQQQFKYIIEAAIVSTPEGFTDKTPRSPMNPKPVNKPSARKSLCLLTIILDAKRKTAIYRVVSDKSNIKEIKSGTTLWAMKTKRKGNKNKK